MHLSAVLALAVLSAKSNSSRILHIKSSLTHQPIYNANTRNILLGSNLSDLKKTEGKENNSFSLPSVS